MTHKNFLKSFLILTLGLATAVLTFNSCGDDNSNNNNTETPNKPVETAGFKVGAYNLITGQFISEPVNFNTAFTFAIEVKDAKFKAALDAAPTGTGGMARTLAFFEAGYTLKGSDTKTGFTAPSNEERLTRIPGTYIFYKENYSTGTTLATGASGLIHFRVLVAEIGSTYWYDESNAAGTIDYAGAMTFAVP